MNKFEFLNYIPISGESHIGTAIVRIYGKIIARYKIVPKKDGTGNFPAPASVKVDQSEKPYKHAIEFDSNYENEELKEFIMKHVKQATTPAVANQPADQYKQIELFPQSAPQVSNEGVYWENPPF